MKISSLAKLVLASLAFVSAQAGTYNTTDLFDVSCYGSGFTILPSLNVNLIADTLWTAFAVCFGPYTYVAPGDSIPLTRRDRLLSGVEEEELMNSSFEKGSGRELSGSIRTCPNNCYKPSNRYVCAYNGCATSGNGSTRARHLRMQEKLRKLGTFTFDLPACENTLNAALQTLAVTGIYHLNATITSVN